MIILKKTRVVILFFLISFNFSANASYILIPMDRSQKNHLKSYGLAYWVLENGIEVNWLLNYRGGSFMFAHGQKMENESLIRGVSYEVISDAQSLSILEEI